MTQNSTAPNALQTFFRVWGKDRLSDPWICAEFRFRWQAIQWADARAFVLRDLQGEPQVAAVAPEGRNRIEWFTKGGWEPYTSWERAENRTRLLEWIEREQRSGSLQLLRVVIEDEPHTIVGL